MLAVLKQDRINFLEHDLELNSQWFLLHNDAVL